MSSLFRARSVFVFIWIFNISSLKLQISLLYTRLCKSSRRLKEKYQKSFVDCIIFQNHIFLSDIFFLFVLYDSFLYLAPNTQNRYVFRHFDSPSWVALGERKAQGRYRGLVKKKRFFFRRRLYSLMLTQWCRVFTVKGWMEPDVCSLVVGWNRRVWRKKSIEIEFKVN